jgi:AbrB family transcriptional regulator (stage V sporulation protein T)
MKHTGIVRKLDTLGRIVIPREYRKMHKIKESDPLEIIALENGDIVIRKVDISAELVNAGKSIADELSQTLGHAVMLSDTEKFLSAAGTGKAVPVGRELSEKVNEMIEERKCYSGKASEIGLEGAEYVAVCPVAGEDLFGAMYVFSDTELDANAVGVLKMTARILGSLLQRF